MFWSIRSKVHVENHSALELFFSCLNTQVFLMETIDGLDTDTCLIKITRFMGWRGWLNTIIGDNGSNFVNSASAIKKLMKEWNQIAIHDILAHHRVIWKFNKLERITLVAYGKTGSQPLESNAIHFEFYRLVFVSTDCHYVFGGPNS